MLTARKENACRIAAVARTNAAIGAVLDCAGVKGLNEVAFGEVHRVCLDRLNAESTGVSDSLENQLDALEPRYRTPEQMAARVMSDYEKPRKRIQLAAVHHE